jgi:thioredoxin 1
MKIQPRFSLATALLVAIGTVLAIAQTNRPVANSTGACCLPITNLATIANNAPTNTPAPQSKKKPLPKLLDLGAGKCIPCKMMAPILEQLKTEYVGKLEVEFIDVWKTPDAGKLYGIQMIPTQIFHDTTGKELFRHIGFLSKDDILAKWKELGVNLNGSK